MKANFRSIIKYLLWGSLLRVSCALFFGGIFYAFWLLVFLGINPQGGFLETLSWISAPLVTGVGFALGTYTYNKVRHGDQGGFFRIAIWPITGCTIGALAVYWYGPMLIVFSMLAAGALSIFFRDVILLRVSGKG